MLLTWVQHGRVGAIASWFAVVVDVSPRHDSHLSHERVKEDVLLLRGVRANYELPAAKPGLAVLPVRVGGDLKPGV